MATPFAIGGGAEMSLNSSPIITLLTDFGDFYPGVMKGNILKFLKMLNSKLNVRIIDVTHSIKQQDVIEGAFLLLNSYKFFPPSIHVAVVDPGVGGERQALVVECREHVFIGPDNGLLYPAFRDAELERIWKINRDKINRLVNHVSNTFHGRDIFAPAAAHMLADRISDIAEEINDQKEAYCKLELFEYSPDLENSGQKGNKIQCRILHIDRFGNAVTNLKKEFIDKINPKSFYISGQKFPLVEYYSEVEKGYPLSLIGSFDTLEFGLREGNFSRTYGIENGLLELRFE